MANFYLLISLLKRNLTDFLIIVSFKMHFFGKPRMEQMMFLRKAAKVIVL